MKEAALRKLTELFAIDPRSLAVLRIGMAAVLLVDLLLRMRDVDAFYADDGLLSFDVTRQISPLYTLFSLNFLNGSAEFQLFLFVLGIIFAAALLLGYQTRIATVCCWLLVISLQSRMTWVCNGGDMLLRLLLFWSMFLPLGNVWSLDALARPRDPARLRPVLSAASVAILIQVCFVYFFTGLLKFNNDWLGNDWLGGDAVFYTLSLDFFARPTAVWLRQYPDWLQPVSLGTLALELGAPILVFFPWKTAWIRLAAIAAVTSMHIGIELTLTVGIFSAISLVAWSVFLPPMFWRCLGWRFKNAGVQEADANAWRPVPAASAWRFAARVAAGAVVTFFIVDMTAWNIASAWPAFRASRPPRIAMLDGYVKVGQTWNMFFRAPRDNGWYTAEAVLESGERVDVLTGEPPFNPDVDERDEAVFPNYHWCYYFWNLKYYPHLRERGGNPTAEFLMRRWNENHSKSRQAVSLTLTYYQVNNERHHPSRDFRSQQFGFAGERGLDFGDF